LSEFLKNGCSGTPTQKKRSERPRKTTKRTDELLKHSVMIQPTLTAKEIKHEHYDLLKDVSVRTIRHRLQKELNLPARHAAKKPFLSDKMRKKRILFCKKYIH